jgi:hypothetical protein
MILSKRGYVQANWLVRHGNFAHKSDVFKFAFRDDVRRGDLGELVRAGSGTEAGGEVPKERRLDPNPLRNHSLAPASSLERQGLV